MYAEVIVDRPIIKRDRRSFVDAPEDEDIPYPELAEMDEVDSVSANNPLALTFHYSIPAELASEIRPGQLVAVPFRNEQLPAVVVGLSKSSPVDQTKAIAAVLDPIPVLNATQIGLARRPNEENGVDYFFVSTSEFAELIEQGELLEYAIVYGDYKGIPKDQVRQALASGKDVIMRIDVQGAATIRRLVPEAVLIYLSAESEEALVRRLRERKTEPEDQLKIRIATARQELKRLDLFDYVVINAEDKLDRTCQKIAAIISAEKCRVDQREINL